MEAALLQERVEVAVTDHVATVTFKRGERHNALDGAMFRGIREAGQRVATEPGVRCVVLHGEGKSFCSGLDIQMMSGADDMTPQDLMDGRDPERGTNLAQEVCVQWARLPVPVIVAIQGNCLGGGMQIALGGDVRIVAPDAKLSIREAQWGLIPDMGITETARGLMRADVLRELTYTGRIVSGEEAVALGLATRVAGDPLAAAQELAAEIAGRSPDAVRAAKRLWREAPSTGRDDALALETELQYSLIGQPNQLATLTAAATGEPPQFTDPE